MLTRVKYVSRFARPMTPADVRHIVEAAQRHNATIGVTGILLAFGGVFMQVLEGPTDTVQALFGRIVADPRHRDVVVIRSQPTTKHIFSGWSMRLLDLGDAARRDAAPLLVLIEAAARGNAHDTDLLRDIDDRIWRTLGERVMWVRPTG